MVGVTLEGKGRGGVPREGLEASYGLPAARHQAQAGVPRVVDPARGQSRPNSGLKLLLTTFCASRGVPFDVVNTRPLSCHPTPALTFSSS